MGKHLIHTLNIRFVSQSNCIGTMYLKNVTLNIKLYTSGMLPEYYDGYLNFNVRWDACSYKICFQYDYQCLLDLPLKYHSSSTLNASKMK